MFLRKSPFLWKDSPALAVSYNPSSAKMPTDATATIRYRQIARVALPIVFANALVPLQGLIDTATIFA